jgi:hypothetical protein
MFDDVEPLTGRKLCWLGFPSIVSVGQRNSDWIAMAELETGSGESHGPGLLLDSPRALMLAMACLQELQRALFLGMTKIDLHVVLGRDQLGRDFYAKAGWPLSRSAKRYVNYFAGNRSSDQRRLFVLAQLDTYKRAAPALAKWLHGVPFRCTF